MASRYGWTFEYIFSMDYKEFMDSLDIINEARKEEYQDQMALEAFGSWQILEALKSMLGGNKKTTPFTDYAKSLGLLEEKPQQMKKMAIEYEKNLALQNANEILQLDREGRKE